MAFENLAVFVLQKISAVSVQDPGAAAIDGGAVFEALVDAVAKGGV